MRLVTLLAIAHIFFVSTLFKVETRHLGLKSERRSPLTPERREQIRQIVSANIFNKLKDIYAISTRSRIGRSVEGLLEESVEEPESVYTKILNNIPNLDSLIIKTLDYQDSDERVETITNDSDDESLLTDLINYIVEDLMTENPFEESNYLRSKRSTETSSLTFRERLSNYMRRIRDAVIRVLVPQPEPPRTETFIGLDASGYDGSIKSLERIVDKARRERDQANNRNQLLYK